MRVPSTRLPAALFYASVVLFLCLAFSAFRLFQVADQRAAEAVRLSRLLESTRADLELLDGYEAVCDRLGAAPPRAFSSASLREGPAGAIPEPDEKNERLLEPVDGFQAKEVDWSWKAVDKRKAFEWLAFLRSPVNASWRVAGMEMEALPDGESVSLRLRLQTARPVVDAPVDR